MNFFRVFNFKTIKYCIRIDKLLVQNYCVKSAQKYYHNGLITKHSRQISFTYFLMEDKIIKTPPFAESVTEGDVRWSKKPGDTVVIDEVVGEIETDKTAIPIHSPFNGTILEMLVPDGSKVIANQDLMKITIGDAAVDKKPTGIPSTEPAKQKESDTKIEGKPSQSLQNDKLIKEIKPPTGSLNLSTSVKQQISSPTPSNLVADSAISGIRTEQRVKMNRMRLRIAQRLKDAQNTCAMLTTFNECDMTQVINIRKKYQEAFSKKHGVKLGFMSAFVKGAALALHDQPIVNAVIDGTDIIYRDYIDISVAVAAPNGLVVPVLRNVHQMGFGEIERGIHELSERARLGQLAIEDMDGGTFTISNGGVFGSMMGTPIINPPQSAILGIHAIVDRPVAIDGRVEIRPMMYLALTYDHRLLDGREGVLFLRKIKAFVEDPRIVLLGL